MPYFDKTLLEASKNAGKKLVSEIGDSVVAKYINYEIVEDEKFGGVKYQFRFALPDGSQKFISTRSGKVLGKMAKIAPGSKLQVTKLGDGQKTDYAFKVLGVPKSSAPIVKEDPEELDTIQVEEEDEDEEDGEDLLEAQF